MLLLNVSVLSVVIFLRMSFVATFVSKCKAEIEDI